MAVDPIALSIPAFFVLIGIEVAVARWRGLRVYRFADAITDLSCGISSQTVGVFTKLLIVLPYLWLYDHRLLTLEGALGHTVAFLGVDVAYYWWHRWTHEVNLGWTTHVVHHQSQDYNLAVALRQSMTSSLSSWPFYLPLAILGVSPWVFGLHIALNTLYQFWIHTELVRSTGPLEWVLNTPSHHRVHHGTNPEYLDKNYAGVLIIWDRLFGTFEREEAAPVYGTVKPLESFNPLWANVWYAWMLVKDSAAAPSAWQAAKVWWAHPGWRPDGLPPYPAPEPVSREAQRKYDPALSPGLAGYIIAQFVPIGVAMVGMLMVRDTADWGVLIALASAILAANLTWGGLFERRSWAPGAELARLAASGGLAAWLAVTAGQPAAMIGVAAWVLGSAVFVLRSPARQAEVA
ncbi:MAG: alkylglycerol monooxygenase [Myxococcota bacterium]|jgi:alkylglycerol monooxygenase